MPAKLPEENLDRAIQPRLVMPGDRDGEVPIDQKPAIARLHFGGQGHEIQGLLRLRLNHGCEYGTHNITAARIVRTIRFLDFAV